MSRFFPRADYAEDQPLYKTILATHVIYRGFQSGAAIGSAIGVGGYAVRRLRSPRPQVAMAATVPTAATATAPPLSRTLVRSAGTGALVGSAALAVALTGLMWPKQTIEWQDRSYRLLANRYQVEVDDWSLAGSAAGAAAARARGLGWRGVVGAAALGNLVGVAGYMGWRHGISGGKYAEDKTI